MSIGYSVVANLYDGDFEQFKKSINGALARDYMKYRYLVKIDKLNQGFVFDDYNLGQAKAQFKEFILEKSLSLGYQSIYEYSLNHELFV